MPVCGHNSLATSKPLKRIGSYWSYATTLYDYLRWAMPFSVPQSHSSGEAVFRQDDEVDIRRQCAAGQGEYAGGLTRRELALCQMGS